MARQPSVLVVDDDAEMRALLGARHDERRVADEAVPVLGRLGRAPDDRGEQRRGRERPGLGRGVGGEHDPGEAAVAELGDRPRQGQVVGGRRRGVEGDVEADHRGAGALEPADELREVVPRERLALSDRLERVVIDRDDDDVGHELAPPEAHQEVERLGLRPLEVARRGGRRHDHARGDADGPELQEPPPVRAPPGAEPPARELDAPEARELEGGEPEARELHRRPRLTSAAGPRRAGSAGPRRRRTARRAARPCPTSSPVRPPGCPSSSPRPTHSR